MSNVTLAIVLGSIVIVVALYTLYPAAPDVALVGRMPFSIKSLTWRTGAAVISVVAWIRLTLAVCVVFVVPLL